MLLIRYMPIRNTLVKQFKCLGPGKKQVNWVFFFFIHLQFNFAIIFA